MSAEMDGTAGTVLVTGATGQQGGATAYRLLAGGRRVRALTRDPSGPAARALAEAGAEVVAGDMADRAGLAAAADGVYGVFSVQPTAGMPGMPPEYRPEDEIRLGVNVADAAHRAGVRHLVYASAFGVADAADGANGAGLSTLAAKGRIEEHIRTLGLSATVLRPVSFMENYVHAEWGLRDGSLASPLAPATAQQLIAVADIGAVAAGVFADPERFGGRPLDLAADELTPVGIAAAISRATGRTVPYVRVPMDLVRELSEEAARGIQALNDGLLASVDLQAVRRRHPGLLTFEDWLARTGTARLRVLLG